MSDFIDSLGMNEMGSPFKFISLVECRKLLGKTCKDWSDDEVRQYRDYLYDLANFAIDQFQKQN